MVVGGGAVAEQGKGVGVLGPAGRDRLHRRLSGDGAGQVWRECPCELVQAKDLLDRTFEIGIILKGLDGILELLGGALLLAVSPATISGIVGGLTRHELSEDPDDLIATHLLRLAHGLTGSAVLFAAGYLLLHGMVKVVLVAALLRNKVWAYPWMIAFLIVFIGYQLYRIALHPALGLTALTVFDACIAWLTWREYRKQRTATSLAPI